MNLLTYVQQFPWLILTARLYFRQAKHARDRRVMKFCGGVSVVCAMSYNI